MTHVKGMLTAEKTDVHPLHQTITTSEAGHEEDTSTPKPRDAPARKSNDNEEKSKTLAAGDEEITFRIDNYALGFVSSNFYKGFDPNRFVKEQPQACSVMATYAEFVESQENSKKRRELADKELETIREKKRLKQAHRANNDKVVAKRVSVHIPLYLDKLI